MNTKTREELVIEEIEAKYDKENLSLMSTEEEKMIKKFVDCINPIVNVFFSEIAEYINRETEGQFNKDNFNKVYSNNLNFNKTKKETRKGIEEIKREISKFFIIK